MKIQSNRQFRNYVISWFLMVAGLIVSLGGYAIYESVETFIFESYEKEKLTQAYTIASLVDAKAFNQINIKAKKDSAFTQSFSEQFKKLSERSGINHRIYSLKLSDDNTTLHYVSDSLTTRTAAIIVSIYQYRLLLSLDPSGRFRFSEAGSFHSQLVKVDKEKTQHFNLIEKSGFTELFLNGVLLAKIAYSPDIQIIFESQQKISNRQQKLIKKTINEEDIAAHFQMRLPGDKLYQSGVKFGGSDQENSQLIDLINNRVTGFRIGQHTNPLTNFTVYSPIKVRNKVSGLVGIEVSKESQSELREGLLKPILFGFSLLAVALMIAAIFFARKITNPMEQLTLAISRLIQHDFNFKLSPKSFGSFGYLANQFNLMLVRLQKSRSELIQLNKSYSRFVPHQLLKQLTAGGVNEISLGDSCERNMTVLFCDIRGFTTLSETMSPAANFRFINRYLSQIAPVINKHGGIIDKYLGDGIMALFPNGADEALTAAIQMLESLDNYNKKLEQNKLPIIEVGLGLHTGKTMLGTVGTSSRMDATVISDTVNAAARVESMTKAFATKILITEETKKEIKDLSKYRMRYIATCQIQGKTRPVTLYEIFNNDSLSVQREKLNNQSVMIQAWKTYKNGDSALAIQMYQKLLEKSNHDKSLFALIERCQSGRL